MVLKHQYFGDSFWISESDGGPHPLGAEGVVLDDHNDKEVNEKKKKKTKCVKANFKTMKRGIINPTYLVHKVWSIYVCKTASIKN